MADKIDFNGVLEKVLKAKSLNYTSKQADKYIIHTIPLRLSRSKLDIQLKIRIASNGDGKIWSYVVQNVPRHRRTAVLEAMNGRMDAYRFVCFAMDSDNDVCAGYDFEVFGGEEDACRHIRVIYDLFVDILDKCMPDIQQAVWKEGPREESGEFLRMNLFGQEEEE